MAVTYKDGTGAIVTVDATGTRSATLWESALYTMKSNPLIPIGIAGAVIGIPVLIGTAVGASSAAVSGLAGGSRVRRAPKWAPRGTTNKGKHCLIYGSYWYDDRDVPRGIRYGKATCYRTSRQAKSAYRSAVKDMDFFDESLGFSTRSGKFVTIRKSPKGHGDAAKLTPREEKRAIAAAKRRWGEIPF